MEIAMIGGGHGCHAAAADLVILKFYGALLLRSGMTSALQRVDHLFAGGNISDRGQRCDGCFMGLVAERRTAVGKNNVAKIQRMGIAHSGGHPAVADDATENQGVQSSLVQYPFQPTLKKGRERDFFHAQVSWLQVVDQRLTKTAGGEIALAEERPQFLKV